MENSNLDSSECCGKFTNSPNHGRVHFSEDFNEINGHNANIQIEVLNQFVVKVNLGFLQVRHKYEIDFSFDCPEAMSDLFDLDNPIQPSHVRIIDLKKKSTSSPSSSTTSSPAVIGDSSSSNPVEAILADSSSTGSQESSRITITAHLYAYKEKLLKEKVMLHSKTDKTHSLTLIFYGRVLGNGKGTPFLKQGIKCIGFDLGSDDESDSDFNY